MIERELTIKNRAGIHARPAANIVKTASRFKSSFTLIKDTMQINGRSIMGVITLGAPYGSTITMQVDGPDEKEMADAIEYLFNHRFEEQ